MPRVDSAALADGGAVFSQEVPARGVIRMISDYAAGGAYIPTFEVADGSGNWLQLRGVTKATWTVEAGPKGEVINKLSLDLCPLVVGHLFSVATDAERTALAIAGVPVSLSPR